MNKKDYSDLPRSRKEALKVGSIRYYTGIPCKNGHNAPKYTERSLCTKCNQERSKKYIENRPEKEKEYKARRRAEWRELSPNKRLYKIVRYRERRKGEHFTSTEQDINIPSLCEVTGRTLEQGIGQKSPNSPSVDRIDNLKGYTPNNCRVISWRANNVKGDGSLLEHLQVVLYMLNNGCNLDEDSLDVLLKIMEKSNV